MKLSELFARKPKETAAMAQLAAAREALGRTTDSNMKAALQSDIDALCVEVAFDELVGRDAQGRHIAEAREQLRKVEQLISGAPADSVTLLAIIELAIHHGAPIYNQGSGIGCAYIYDYAARMILRKLAGVGSTHPLGAVKRRLQLLSFQPITAMTANNRAWDLRHAFDEVLPLLSDGAVDPITTAKPSSHANAAIAPEPVFVSHAAPDRGEAERIVHLLESAGIPCWMAPRNVPRGANYAGEIVDAIRRANTVLLLLSSHSNASKFVPKEVERADSYGKRIVTVRLENVAPSRELELFVSLQQWTDVFDGDPRAEENLRGLVADLRAENNATQSAGPSD